MREDGADADGVFVTPVHAGLFAASDDQDSGGGFDMPGGDEEAGLSELAVAHVLLALADVVEFLIGFRAGAESLRIFGFEAFDNGGGPDSVQEVG